MPSRRASDTQEHAVLKLAKQRPLLRARDLTERSLPTIVLSRLVATGKLERVARGVYSLPSRKLSEHSSLAEVCLRVPQGVICLLSALRLHGIGTQAPFEVWIATLALCSGAQPHLMPGSALPLGDALLTTTACDDSCMASSDE